MDSGSQALRMSRESRIRNFRGSLPSASTAFVANSQSRFPSWWTATGFRCSGDRAMRRHRFPRFYYPGLGSCKSRDSANSTSRTVRNGQESYVWRSAIAWLSRAQQAARVPEAAFRWWNPSGSHAGVFGVSCLHIQSDTRSHRWSERTDIEHETASSRAYGPQGGFLACVPRLQPIEASL